MSEPLYHYYEQELSFIRNLAKEFARLYPKTAGRLLLDPERSNDPHVERLIESFALLAGRVRHKIDDEFPELTDSLLGVLYPHYLAPIPSMAVVDFDLDPGKGDLPNGFLIDRGSRLKTRAVEYLPGKSRPVEFRTAYPVTLWPVTVASAKVFSPPFPGSLQAIARAVTEDLRNEKKEPKIAAVLRLQLEVPGDGFAALNLDKLRFFLAGDPQLVANLYEIIFNHTVRVVLRPGERDAPQPPVVLRPEEALGQVGFERDEALLPYPNTSFLGYRLLTEFFTFPQKFHFVDLSGFRQAKGHKYGRTAEVLLFLNRTLPALEQGVSADTFRLGCTPVINLFHQIAEPIALTQSRFEYRVVPDVTHALATEVYSVDGVVHADPVTGQTTEYRPFYSFRHGGSRLTHKAFWYASRRPSLVEGDEATEVFLHLVDLDFNPRLPSEPTLVVRTTCTNRNLAAKLQHLDDVYFELEAAAPLSRIRCVRSPTPPLRPPLRRGAHWRLLSHLTLNHLSLDGDEGREALQEILRVYDFSDPKTGQQLASVTANLIEGITAVRSRKVVGRTGAPTASGFARGTEVTVEFDEQKYVGTGAFLFASVLERFLGLYASLNSFTQLVAAIRQGEGYFKKWPPRAGELQLL